MIVNLLLTLCAGAAILAAYYWGRVEGLRDGIEDGRQQRDEVYEQKIAELEAEVRARVLPPMSGRLQWHGAPTSAADDYITAARQAGIAVGGLN